METTTKRKFNAGDKVHWAHSRSIGNRWSFSTRDGVVIEGGEKVTLVKHRGKQIVVETEDLRLQSEPSALTEMLKSAAADAAEPLSTESK